MYIHKMNEHKLRQSHSGTPGAEKRSTRRKKISSPIMTVFIGSDQYARLEKANKNNDGVILKLVSTGNVNKRGRGEPFTGKMVVMLE